jgi:hypothetical protein
MERFFSQQSIELYRKLLDTSAAESQRRPIFKFLAIQADAMQMGANTELAHETADLLGIDDYAAMAQFGANPAIAIGFELIADRSHGRDQRSVVSRQ